MADEEASYTSKRKRHPGNVPAKNEIRDYGCESGRASPGRTNKTDGTRLLTSSAVVDAHGDAGGSADAGCPCGGAVKSSESGG